MLRGSAYRHHLPSQQALQGSITSFCPRKTSPAQLLGWAGRARPDLYLADCRDIQHFRETEAQKVTLLTQSCPTGRVFCIATNCTRRFPPLGANFLNYTGLCTAGSLALLRRKARPWSCTCGFWFISESTTCMAEQPPLPRGSCPSGPSFAGARKRLFLAGACLSVSMSGSLPARTAEVL